MSATSIIESCSCGATFDVSARWRSDACIAADEWRKGHKCSDSGLGTSRIDDRASSGADVPFRRFEAVRGQIAVGSVVRQADWPQGMVAVVTEVRDDRCRATVVADGGPTSEMTWWPSSVPSDSPFLVVRSVQRPTYPIVSPTASPQEDADR